MLHAARLTCVDGAQVPIMLKSERCNLHEAATEQEATNLGECPYDQVMTRSA
jgi:hypothetical protein